MATLIIFWLFVFICKVVDDYIGEALLFISNSLGMSDALAGVTLIAFANGAGDVITSLVAGT